MALSDILEWNLSSSSSCGSSCGADDTQDEKPSACGSSCGAGNE